MVSFPDLVDKVSSSRDLGTLLGFPQSFSRELNIAVYTAISRKIVGKMCTPQSRKVIWDMINTLFRTTVHVEPTFAAFF